MIISHAKANKFFTVFVQRLGTPDCEVRRWAFIQSVAELHATRYNIDSDLGPNGWFINTGTIPMVVCKGIDPLLVMRLKQTNKAIREINRVRPAKTIRTVHITVPPTLTIQTIMVTKPDAIITKMN